MDSTNNNHSSHSRGRDRSQSGGVGSAMTKAVHSEADVKKDAGPAVSNTYVAETMTVTNNYNF